MCNGRWKELTEERKSGKQLLMTETAYFSIITTKFGTPGLWTCGVGDRRSGRFALTSVWARVWVTSGPGRRLLTVTLFMFDYLAYMEEL